MIKFNKILFFVSLVLFVSVSAFSSPFNENLTNEEILQLNNGEVLIKNINFAKNMCLNKGISIANDNLINEIHDLNPKYLAEVIEFKPVEGNEDLPERLTTLLNNVSDYAGIPYYSVRAEAWYDLYTSAEIKKQTVEGNKTVIDAEFLMDPFDIVEEQIVMTDFGEAIVYVAENQNKLRYLDKFDCIWPHKMKICILLFKDNDKWILYGIGGVNAPRIPLFTERIQTSFINRINTFCGFIFKQL